jgi:hypothetical protein
MLWLTARASASPSRCLRQIDQISGEYRSTRASPRPLVALSRAGHQIDNQQVIEHRVTSSGMPAGRLVSAAARHGAGSCGVAAMSGQTARNAVGAANRRCPDQARAPSCGSGPVPGYGSWRPPVTDHLPGAGRAAIRGSSYLRTGVLEPYPEKNRRVRVVAMTESVSSRDLRAMMDLIRDGLRRRASRGTPGGSRGGAVTASALRFDLLVRAEPGTSALHRRRLRT